jgi:hypothetical protein
MVEHLRFQFLVNSDHCLKIVVAPLMRGSPVSSGGLSSNQILNMNFAEGSWESGT